MSKNPLKKFSDKDFEKLSDYFKALSEISRLKIVQALQSGEKNVNELVEITNLSQPNVSKHLKILLTSNLIGRRKEGNLVMYRITDSKLLDLCTLVCKAIK